ncbi:MAG: STAS/SEC14 domain-containing protein [Allosphingosinicella sp.]
MIEMLETEAGVLAATFSGKLSRQDIETFTRLIEQSLGARDKTHIFAEVVDFNGLELEGFADWSPRGAAMLKRLDRFGRVAVVSDQPWIRWATKVESAILPGISYETFERSERDQALAWVEGKRPLPHGPAVSIIETDRDDVLGFEIDGKLTAAEVEALSKHFNAALAAGRPLRLLGRVKRIGGAELRAFFDRGYFTMKRGMLERLERYAIVGGPGWLRASVGFLDPLMKAEIRHFEGDEEARAWEWLGAKPERQRPIIA